MGTEMKYYNQLMIGGESTIPKMSQYASTSDSLSLAKIGDKQFTIVALEDSDYEEGDTRTPGVKITTKESFEYEGETYNKLHTTRITLTNKLRKRNKDGDAINSKIHEDLANGETIGPMKCELVTAKKGGKDYFDLIDV